LVAPKLKKKKNDKLQASIWDIFGSDQTTGCPRNHMKTYSNIDGLHCM
jgi:hypothetical protein